MPTTTPNPAVIAAILSGIGIFVTIVGWFVQHHLTKRREARRDQRLREEAVVGRLRTFHDLVAEIKATIATSGNPEVWVNFFLDRAIPTLEAEFNKISRELSDADRTRGRKRLDAVLAFGDAGGAEVYPKQQELVTALAQLEKFQER